MATRKKTTFLVIRHGETRWNMENRYQGHGDSPLTPLGRRQAKALGRRMQVLAFDTMIASDLGRTRETAAIIASFSGHHIQTDSRLRERNYGVLEGLTVPEINDRHPQVMQRLGGGDPDYIIPAGESHRQHFERNTACFRDLVAQHPRARIALVVHGGVLDSFFRLTAGLELDHPRCFTAANTGLSTITYGKFYGTRRWVIETWNDAAHLEGIDSYPNLG